MLLAKLTPRWPHHAGETTLAMAPFCWRATRLISLFHRVNALMNDL